MNAARSRSAEIPERVVRVHLRTALSLTATLIAVFAGLYLLWLTRQIIIWLFIAIFLAVALDPLVTWFQRHGVRSRGLAVLAAIVVVIGALTGVGLLLIPPLITQIGDLADSLPTYVEDLTNGRGPLGFLERDYQVVERVRERVEGGGAGGLVIGIAGGALNVAAGILTAIAAVATITVMVIFLLLGGPRWVESFYGALPEHSQERWRRVGGDLYRSVGGYVRGNLAISLVAGVSAAAVLLALGIEYALALALVVAILDLVPLVGATLGAAIVLGVVAFDSLTAAIVWLVFAIVYQQLENHLLQPLVYGRMVLLPPFAVLLAVLIGAQLGGVVGALGAIPVASAIQILTTDIIRERRAARIAHPQPL
jgi:predicted PurR-regulated permease PerM